jgi:hypothetical protein
LQLQPHIGLRTRAVEEIFLCVDDDGFGMCRRKLEAPPLSQVTGLGQDERKRAKEVGLS